MLITNADMLKPGDEIAWTRVLPVLVLPVLYDHHALVKTVTRPNTVEVYEFTTTGNGLSSGPKTVKALSTVPIFNGSDPCYKVIRTPPKDPAVLLRQAELSLGRLGNYNVANNNCENYAANQKDSFGSQFRGFLNAIYQALTKLTANTPALAANLIDDVVRYAAAGGLAVIDDAVKSGLQKFVSALNVAGFIVPLIVEVGMILWDINHDWSDHKKTRAIVGLGGTAVTSLLLFGMALVPLSLGMSILMALGMLLVGMAGSALTRLAQNGVRRLIDQQTCCEAFGMPTLGDKIKKGLRKVWDTISGTVEDFGAFLSKITRYFISEVTCFAVKAVDTVKRAVKTVAGAIGSVVCKIVRFFM